MKIFKTDSTRFSDRCAPFIGAMLLTALLMAAPTAFAAGPAAVNLGTAANFAALAKAGISTTGTTSIVGDIGISPAAASYITGFGLIMDVTNTFSRSSIVTGKIYAADYTAPTPTYLTTAVSDMETAYTDAAGRTTPDFTELGAGDISGMTLVPGLYKWGTGLLIDNTGITISGAADDVWIFQIAGTLTVNSNAIVTLSGGAQAKNIFWQVAGQTTLGTTSQFKGNILDQTAIVMNTGSTLDGRALAQTEVTIDANTVTKPVDAETIPPTVSSTDPANNDTDVPLNQKIAATFSEAMNPATISTATFTVKQGLVTVTGTVSYVGLVATFTPSANLAGNTAYTATVTSGAKDLAGNALASDYVWNFTTGAAPDIIPPTVSSTDPANNDTDVPLNQKIAATFSEAMDPATISTATFTLAGPGATPVFGTISRVGLVSTFTPSSNLASNTAYTATVTSGAKDLAGNAMASDYVWIFTTGAAPDITPPTVSSTDPANNDTGVPLNQKIAATFSEAMDPTTISTATFTVKQGLTSVTGTVSYVGLVATFTPSADLAGNTAYTATITSGAKDLAGIALASDYVWNFTTGAAPDIIYPPMVSSTYPANNDTDVPTNQKIAATFSKAMDPASISAATFTVKQGLTSVTGTVSYVGLVATFTPSTNLAVNTAYTATITSGAKDLAGSVLAGDYVWNFTTGAVPDITPPMVSFTDPANNKTDVPTNQKIAATFSKAMDPATISTATFTVKQGLTTVTGTVSHYGLVATFTPSSNLAANTAYTATITTGAKDLVGNALASNYVWNFATGAAPDITPPTLSSTNPASSATGVPTNQQIAVTFNEAMNPESISTATFTLSGTGSALIPGTVIYAGNTATFKPTTFLASNIVYTATIASEVNDLAGNTLEGNYVWNFTTGTAPDITAPTVSSTDPANNAMGVPTNQQIAATFSEVMDPATISTATFTVKQGLTSVTGVVTYAGKTVTFTPSANLAGNAAYTATITYGAKDLAGNTLASNYVWNFTTGAAPDITAPTVSSLDPANNATGVPTNQQIAATFSEAMNPATISTATFRLTGPGAAPVTGVVTYAGKTVTFTPSANLAGNIAYTATITSGARDLAGNALASDYVWNFTTGTAPDITPPTMSSTDPASSATGVPTNQQIAVTFSEAMDPTTISTATFTLTGTGSAPVSGTVTYAGNTATFKPTTVLAGNIVYTATITSGTKDLAGNALASDYVWNFTTGAAPDITPPTMSSIDPADNATNVPISQQISATFSEAMDPATISTVTFTVKQGLTPVPGTVTYAGKTVTFTPSANLAGNTPFIATITSGAKDLAGNALASDYVWNFTTETPTAVENDLAPHEFSLSQNFPNPFNPSTTIQYSLASAGMVSLKVYNVVGQEVAMLVNSHQNAGSYTITFYAEDLSNGVYFYRMEAGPFVSMKKLVFMK